MSELNASQLLAALKAAEDRVDAISGELRQAKEEYDAIYDQIMVYMDGQETTMLAAGGFVAEIKVEPVPQLKDWNAFELFCIRHKRIDLLQRRISAVVWRELLEERGGMAIPGVEPFEKRKLSVRKKGK